MSGNRNSQSPISFMAGYEALRGNWIGGLSKISCWWAKPSDHSDYDFPHAREELVSYEEGAMRGSNGTRFGQCPLMEEAR